MNKDKERAKTEAMQWTANELTLAINIHTKLADTPISFNSFVSAAKELFKDRREYTKEQERSFAKAHREFPKSAVLIKKDLHCPECANQMVLQPVIAVKGYENRFGWKSVLRCYSCGHEEFFLETMDSKVKQLKDIQVNK